MTARCCLDLLNVRTAVALVQGRVGSMHSAARKFLKAKLEKRGVSLGKKAFIRMSSHHPPRYGPGYELFDTPSPPRKAGRRLRKVSESDK
jgi:hypothetical protein